MNKEDILNNLQLSNKKEYKILIYTKDLLVYFNSKASKSDVIRKIESILNNYDLENLEELKKDDIGINIKTNKENKKITLIIDYYDASTDYHCRLYTIKIEEK